MLTCESGLVSVPAVKAEARGDLTTVMLDYGITEASGPVSCIGASVAVPDEFEVVPRVASCELVEFPRPQTFCQILFSVLPHLPIECPAPPPGALRAIDAEQMSTPFGTGTVSCDPASPADIPATEFPGALEDDIVFSVQCSSTETANTCGFDVVLAGRASRPCPGPVVALGSPPSLCLVQAIPLCHVRLQICLTVSFGT